ncbi:hypothetical protein LX15_005260 [Streptoalloteichus tenebrarius]|uniref:Uncharacterized protein n=1 Tax=Streptoalloteichus tenebrarius (strain ATCC 17920 / DSM 40477 / JCM 4838 / CBS 697.72 / NBRC 16177 / NCIMB 11028 / NRRL B-12390 / A12253. 1 / ISP 5477) TaxID=1933 RepID=A0ABT1I189_STRSD|nr:hypothetical protein [Streptoalloteichus tenebrarius]MCP2261534.1 hypothetical protein [Streptoalloteichus tenebrarius]
MSLVPRAVPGPSDPRAARALQPRWDRARPRLLAAAVWLPVAQVGLVAAMVALSLAERPAGSVWHVLPVAGAVVPAVVSWARMCRSGLLDPSTWLSTAFLTHGCQLLVGVFPAFGFALSGASPGQRLVAVALFASSWLALVAGCVLATRASRAVALPLVPDLGATWFRLVLGARFTLARPDLVIATVSVERDRVAWSARKHRSRSSGPSLSDAVALDQIRAMWTVSLSEQDGPRPWAWLSDGTALLTTPGPAVVVRTDHREFLLPVNDAETFVAMVNRRAELWFSLPRQRSAA